jgi:hypothetical protein
LLVTLPNARRVSLGEFGTPLFDFVELSVTFALEQEHHHGLAVALAGVVKGRGTPLLDWHARALGLDRAVTKCADSGLGRRANGGDNRRGLALVPAAEHGAVLTEPVISAEVLDDGSLAPELRASQQHGPVLVDQLELTSRGSQRQSSALSGGLRPWLWL